MCVAMAPMLGILQFAVSAMGAVAQYQQQQQAAEQQNAYYLANAQAANRAAMAAYANQQTEMNLKLQAADQDVIGRRIEGLKARGVARNAAGEAGVTGLSVDALVNDFYGAEGRAVDAVNTNFEIERQNILAQMDATYRQTEARINQVQRATPPSFMGAAVRIAGGALSALSGFGGGSRSMSFAPTTNYALGIG